MLKCVKGSALNMNSSLCILMFLSLCGTVCSPYSCHHPDTFSKALQCFCSRKTFQTFRQTSSVLPHGRYWIHASLTSWPRRVWPLTSVPVCVTGVRGWCGACAWAVAWRPDPSAGDGGHGTAAAPCLSLSPPRCLQRPQGPTLPKVPAQSWKQHSR